MDEPIPDYKALKPYRRCYEEREGALRLFWLSPTNEETPIVPFGADIKRLREIGYKTREEWERAQ